MSNIWIILQGFGLGLSMIVPIGAQNAYVLNQGIKRQHHLTTATICSLCDIIFITLGIFGGGALLSSNATLLNTVTLGGILFLSFYGAMSVKTVLQNRYEKAELEKNASRGRRAVILGALAVTLLNPHVYLDTIVVLGSIGGQFSEDGRIAFATGTLLASLSWFYGVSIAAAKMAPVLGKPKVQRTIDAVIAMIMFSIAWKLALGLYERIV